MNTDSDKALFERVGTTYAMGIDVLRAAERFRVDISPSAIVRISSVGPEFRKLYGNAFEENVGWQELEVLRLLRGARDIELIERLGPNGEVMLSHIWSLLLWQPHGEDGVLARDTNNLFLVRRSEYCVDTVAISWFQGGWRVDAYCVLFGGWRPGQKIFCRKL